VSNSGSTEGSQFVAVVRDQAVTRLTPNNRLGSAADFRTRDWLAIATCNEKADACAYYGRIHELTDRYFLYFPVAISLYDSIAANVYADMVPASSKVTRDNRAWNELFLNIEHLINNCSAPTARILLLRGKKCRQKDLPPWKQ